MNFKKYKNQLNDSFFDDINGKALDNSQRKVILNNQNNLLVVAGAGSGKTLTIIGKVKYLIERLKYQEKDILVISFTNETVNNLINKLNYKVDCYTFHKLSLRIMNEFNIPYNIGNSDLLDYIINEYFYILDTKEYVIEYFKYLLKKDLSYEDILNLKQFILFKRLIKTFISRIQCNNHNILDIRDYLIKLKRYHNKISSHYKNFLIIALSIYNIYLEELNSYQGIDFDMMLSNAINIIKEKGMYYNYKYIIIDEFQDTSFVKYQLIKEIMKITKATIMCVGDDYQSIYGFSGCNLDLFINFKKYFKNAKIMYINKTYRNSYELVNISNRFIRKNHYQLKKRVKANFLLPKPIKLIYYQNNYQETFYKLLDYLIDNNHKNILVLGRNNKDIYSLVDNIDNDSFIYRDISIRYLTVHKSKGLEEEIVILINCNDDYLGFPNKIEDNEVLNIITRNEEKFLYAEERRLFYVALTRTKKYIYILSKWNNESIFVKELINKIDIIKNNSTLY